MGTYDVDAIRKKLKQSMAGKFTDPDEFKPDKAKSTTEPIKYRFFILPPLLKGNKLKSGEVTREMEQFFIPHADHWVNDKPNPCPRVWDGSECPICQFGFDLLRDEKDEDRRAAIVKQWMPTTYYMVNIFFTGWKDNPEDLRGKVKFYNAPKTCFDKWTAALYREDAGDPEDPQAFGVFYDESAGFLFELQALKSGKSNSYKTSKFITKGEAIPMVKNADGTPNKEGLATLLKLRHNLWDKIHIPDPVKIKKLAATMTGGDDADDAPPGGFDADEVVTESQTKQNTPNATESKGKTSAGKPQDKPAGKPPSKTTTKPKEEAKAPVEQVEDALSEEVPFEEETTTTEVTPISGTEIGESEIDTLLGQLDAD